METLSALVLFAVVTTITPGGATTLSTASGMNFGVRRSLPLISGMVSGLATLVFCAGFGLASLIAAAPALELALRLAGSAYLLWLAWRTASNGAPGSAGGVENRPYSYLAGLMLVSVNPKAWAMAFGASAAFAGGVTDPVLAALVMALVFIVCGASALTLWCGAGAMLARLLKTEGQWRLLNGVLGLLLVVSIIPMWV
ncbi:MAG: LysE family transporter [Minwuia sp.]|nr:LysE family transporter [Minwuia sp.]